MSVGVEYNLKQTSSKLLYACITTASHIAANCGLRHLMRSYNIVVAMVATTASHEHYGVTLNHKR